jgi:outer membrane protein, heavy metal efflux system
LVAETRSAAIRLVALRSKEAFLEAQLSNSRELAATHARAAAVGEGSELETAQLELEAAQLETQRVQLLGEIAERRGALALLLGLAPSAELAVAESLALPETKPLAAGPASDRTDLAAVQARGDSARQAVAVARTHRWEDATVGLYGEIDRNEDSPNGVETEGFVGIRFSVPLPLWNDHRNLVSEAAAKAARIEREADALAIRIRAEIAAAEQQKKATAVLAHAIRNRLLPQARSLEERFAKLHAQGQTPFSDVLRARERRLQLEVSELDARRDFHLAHARWMAATGQPHSAQP